LYREYRGMHIIRKYLVIFLLFSPAIAFAQNAAELEAMLKAETVSASSAARFVLGAADLLESGLSGPAAERAAYDIASSNGWIKVPGDESLTMKDTALLIMKAFNIKGGLMYSLFNNPRYAYREMVYQKLISGHMDGGMKVYGVRFLQILDKVISYADTDERL